MTKRRRSRDTGRQWAWFFGLWLGALAAFALGVYGLRALLALIL